MSDLEWPTPAPLWDDEVLNKRKFKPWQVKMVHWILRVPKDAQVFVLLPRRYARRA